ncbi:DUF4349 domain-containing protein [Phytomonospora sp. NPDC050363]|uniref:DUF4349 domain-containing protein n=1 Tax=Phytomonospora sp. NPDC050363 TaxID=3155642 RepID=UPI0033C0DEA1
MRRLARGLVPAALAVLLLAGCSAGPDDADADSGGDPAPASTEDPAAGEDGAERQVVYTGELSLSAPDVTSAARQAIELVTAAGGFVAGDRRELGDGARTTLTLRIPAESFTATVELLAALGTEESRTLSTTDVTETSADLDTRIATKRASVERVRELMEDASSLSEVVELEAELTTRETELAELQADKRDLTDAVAFGSLTLRLDAPAETSAESPTAPPGFGSGLESGWDGLVLFGAVALTILGFMLPFLAVVGVPLAAVWTWSRRRRGLPVLRRKVGRPVQPPPPDAPAEAPAGKAGEAKPPWGTGRF